MFSEYKNNRDSIYQIRISRQVHELEIINETKKKEANVRYLKKEQKLKDSTISKQKLIIFTLVQNLTHIIVHRE